MGILRVLICLFFPPLAVIDKGCGVLLLVCVLTLFGWIPGVLAALVICTQQPPTPQQQSRESSLGAVAFVIFLVVAVAAYFWLHKSSDHSSSSIALAPKPAASSVATIAMPSNPPPVAQTPRVATAAEAQQEAVRRYPEIGVAGSKLNAEFVARYKRYQQERPDFLRDPSWPLRLAEELVPPSTPAPAIKPARRPTQSEANAFLGLTEAQLIQRLGKPISAKTSSSPDGPFKMLEWDRTKGSETFFSIFADDGRVNYGYLRGTPTTAK